MQRKYSIIGGCILALAAGGVGVARAVGGEDESNSVPGPSAEKAKAAAIRLIPDGRPNAVERDSEDGATWEVEVTRSDGKTVDVRLDERYRLVVVEGDSEAADDGNQDE